MRALVLAVLALAALAACGAPQHTLMTDGGSRLTLQASCLPDKPGCVIGNWLDTTKQVLTRRLGSLAITDSVVRVEGADHIVVELPGVTNDAQVVSTLTEHGGVAILDTGTTLVAVGTDVTGKTCAATCAARQFHIVFTGDQIDPSSINAALDPQTNQPAVAFAFAGAAKDDFAKYTASHLGQYLTIAANDNVVESATINSQIDGLGQVSGGNMTVSEAQHLAVLMKSPALPLHLTVLTNEVLQPSTK
ncbi:MAG TPA: hypothetical protein VF807_15470 [Ktedonobacterales bacterium]